MSAVIDFNDLSKHLNYKVVGMESVGWNGKSVSVLTLSSRQSSLIERIVDFVLLILIAVPTMGAALAFPFAADIQKAAFKGRKQIYHVRRSTLPKMDFKKTDSKKNVLMESEGRFLSLRIDSQNSSHQRSDPNEEYKDTVGNLVELGLQDEEIVASMEGSGMEREAILRWVAEKKDGKADLELSSAEESFSGMNSPRPVRIHKDQEKYSPLKVVLAGRDLNQRRAGFPNGCTHFSVRFLEKAKTVDATPDLLKKMLETEHHGIAAGRNGDPLEVIRESSILEIADEAGNSYNDSIPVLLFQDTMAGKKEALQRTIASLARAEEKLAGFVITTGTESCAVRFRQGNLEFFDPHGDVTQEEPTSVFIFNRLEGPKKIAEMIFDRAALIIEETGQLEIFAAKRLYSN